MRVADVGQARSRFSIEKSEKDLRIAIHPGGRTWLAVFMAVVMCAWGTGLAIGLVGLLRAPESRPFYVALLSLMLLVGLLGGAVMIGWELVGIEVITVTRKELLVSHSIGSFVRTRRYGLLGTGRFRVPLEHGSWWTESYLVNPWQVQRGMIQFHYEGRRRCLGLGLGMPEAQAILGLIEARVLGR